jgi:Putative porin
MYKYIERDAVLDAYNDSDFHLGGTNAKGWVIGGNYGLMKNLWFTGRWLSTDVITGPKYGIDTLQLDLNAKF